jgi:hypothetical protein
LYDLTRRIGSVAAELAGAAATPLSQSSLSKHEVDALHQAFLHLTVAYMAMFERLCRGRYEGGVDTENERVLIRFLQQLRTQLKRMMQDAMATDDDVGLALFAALDKFPSADGSWREKLDGRHSHAKGQWDLLDSSYVAKRQAARKHYDYDRWYTTDEKGLNEQALRGSRLWGID